MLASAPSLFEEKLAEIRSRQGGLPNSTFTAKYYNDPAAFVHDCFVWRGTEKSTFYQDEIMQALPRQGRVSARGPRGLGKTALASWLVLWFALTRDAAGQDWKVVTTAGSWRQLTKFLWPEIHKWARRIRWEVVGREAFNARSELMVLSLKLGNGEAFAATSDRPDLIEGAHAEQLFYLFDESKSIAPEVFDSAEGAASNAGSDTGSTAYMAAFSTPGEPNGRFYDIQSRKPGYEDWWVRAVTLEETIQAKRVSREWVEQRRKQWGGNSAVYINHVEGNFASSDEEGIIPLSWVELAIERWHEWAEAGKPGKLTALGVDVGLSGDKTVIARRIEKAVDELEYRPKEDPKVSTMATAGRIKGILNANPLARAVVDVIGIGAGIVHRLNEQKASVVGFNAAEGSKRQDRSGELGFSNKRAEGWWALRELLDPNYGENIALPPDDILIGDLTAPHYRQMSGGRLQVESKADIKKRLGRSTDAGDAVMMAFYEGEITSDVSEGLSEAVEYAGWSV